MKNCIFLRSISNNKENINIATLCLGLRRKEIGELSTGSEPDLTFEYLNENFFLNIFACDILCLIRYSSRYFWAMKLAPLA